MKCFLGFRLRLGSGMQFDADFVCGQITNHKPDPNLSRNPNFSRTPNLNMNNLRIPTCKIKTKEVKYL